MADINDYLDGLNYTFTPEEKQLMDIFAECWEYCQSDNVHCRDCEYSSPDKYGKLMICTAYQYAKRLVAAGYVKREPTVTAPLAADTDFELVYKAFCVNAQWIEMLTDREKRVLVLRYGLDGGGLRTLEQVGREFKVTRERIRQIEARALRKLRISGECYHYHRGERCGNCVHAVIAGKYGTNVHCKLTGDEMKGICSKACESF